MFVLDARTPCEKTHGPHGGPRTGADGSREWGTPVTGVTHQPSSAGVVSVQISARFVDICDQNVYPGHDRPDPRRSCKLPPESR